MKRWEQYQHRTADLLRELGFTAEVNDPLRAPIGVVHRVDVSARIMVAGVTVTWIVECKLWKTRVNKLHVSALKDIVNDLAADRGLLMSEKGFQSGAIQLAAAKNITLSSLDDLRANAAEDLLTARVRASELRLLRLSRRIVRGLRTFRGGAPHLLPELVARISPQDRAEFAAREAAIDFQQGVAELASRAGVTSVRDLAPPGYDVSGMGRGWNDGVDASEMTAVAGAIGHLTQALSQGKLGDWPVICQPPADTPKMAWNMRQLITVVETALDVLEPKVAEQESKLS
jgi:hypothetical protein